MGSIQSQQVKTISAALDEGDVTFAERYIRDIEVSDLCDCVKFCCTSNNVTTLKFLLPKISLANYEPDIWITRSLQHDDLVITNYLLDQGMGNFIVSNVDKYSKVLEECISLGRKDILKRILSMAVGLFNIKVLKVAIIKGDLEIIKIVADQYLPSRQYSTLKSDYFLNDDILNRIILSHNYDINKQKLILDYFIEKGILQQLFTTAIQLSFLYGNLHETYNYLLEKGAIITTEILDMMVDSRNLTLTKFMVTKGLVITEQHLRKAIQNDSMVIVRYYVEELNIPITPEMLKIKGNVSYYFDKIHKCYYGIQSDTELDISFPGIVELDYENKFYYVYELKGYFAEKGYELENEEVKMSVMKQLGSQFGKKPKHYVFNLKKLYS